MPMYEYECLSCGKRTERLQRFDDAPLATCPACGGEVKKLISAPAVQFKGSGWYVTDYAKGSSAGRSDAAGSKDGKESKDSKESGGSKDSGGSKESGSSKESGGSKDSGSSSESKSSAPSSGGGGGGE